MCVIRQRRLIIESSKELVLSVDQVRAIDKLAIDKLGMSGLVLMENAGARVSYAIDAMHVPERIATVLCGMGNNGGDGMVIARHLDALGWKVYVWLIGNRRSQSMDCQSNLSILERSGWKIGLVDTEQLLELQSPALQSLVNDMNASAVVVDAMLGTGSSGPLRQPHAIVVQAANSSRSTRVAVDQPTGMDAQTGEVFDPCFQAETTYTFVALKPGFLSKEAAAVVGELKVVSIGIPRSLLAELM